MNARGWLVLLLPLVLSAPRMQDAPAATPDRVAFVAFGDWGAPPGRSRQTEVRDGMRRFLRGEQPQLALLLGDNFYPDGVTSPDDPQWKVKFEETYSGPEFRFPFYATLGNHDYDGDVEAQREYSERSDRWRMRELPFSHRHGGVPDRPLLECFMIDTCKWKSGRRQRVSRVGKLREMLRRSRARWKVVVGHHPVYSNSEKKDDVLLRRTLRPLLVRYDVDLYLCGDHHNLQLLASRDDTDDRTLYAVSGGGGARLTPLRRRDSMFQHEGHGFLHVALTPEKARLRFVDITGRTLYDAALRRGGGPRAVTPWPDRK